ncbi:hypothetical protein J3Q07_15290 [Pseudomonas sp. D4-18]|uniref:hypothetical protein n=1 Tax=Pseudomonas sp. D4-18 TaxID=2817395 RepID=UPI003DA8BBA8
MKVLVHDGIGVWLGCTSIEPRHVSVAGYSTRLRNGVGYEQLQALVLGLPWQRVGAGGAITLL